MRVWGCISEGILVCTLNVRLLVQYVSRRVVMGTREMMLLPAGRKPVLLMGQLALSSQQERTCLRI